jgi:hypothetical protein
MLARLVGLITAPPSVVVALFVGIGSTLGVNHEAEGRSTGIACVREEKTLNYPPAPSKPRQPAVRKACF